MHRTPAQSVAMNDQAWHRKSAWHGIHSDAYLHGMPGVDPYYGSQGIPPVGQQPRGMSLGEQIYDSTLARSVTKLANRIVQDVCPPGMKWSDFVGGLTEGESESQYTARMETLRDRTFKAFHVSNGDQALHEMVTDCVVSGTGVCRIGAGQEPTVPLTIDSTSQVEVALEAGPRGQVWGFHRKFMLPRDHIAALWPQAELPKPDAADGSQSVHGGLTPALYNVYESTYFDLDAGAWWYDVLSRGMDGSRENEQRLFEEGTPISRWVAWRWKRMPAEIYGRSPVMDALPDARTASEVVRLLLKSAALASGGLYTFTGDSDINPQTTHVEPGSFIQVRSNARDNPSIQPLPIGGDLRMTQLVLEELRMSIVKAMLGEGLPPETAGIRSATEWAARMRELQMATGAAFSRLTEELLRPLLQAIVYVLSEQGLLADVGVPAGQALRLDGTDMDLHFTAPMARQQKQMEVATLVESSQMAQAAAGPEAFQASANTPAISAKIFELNGVAQLGDTKLSRDPEEAEQQFQQGREAQMMGGQPPTQQQPGMGP